MDGKTLTGKRIKIFESIHYGTGKFNDLKKTLSIEGNELSYHLKILKNAGLIEKSGENYVLTTHGKYLHPYIPLIVDDKKPVIIITGVALIKDGKIYLVKKPREPDKGKLIILGGRAEYNMSIDESAIKLAEEDTGLKIIDLKLRCINEYIKKDSEGNIKNHWIVYFYTAKPVGKPNSDVVVIPLSKAKKMELFGDNNYFLEKMLDNKTVKITKTII